jgi:hypothetical protein
MKKPGTPTHALSHASHSAPGMLPGFVVSPYVANPPDGIPTTEKREVGQVQIDRVHAEAGERPLECLVERPGRQAGRVGRELRHDKGRTRVAPEARPDRLLGAEIDLGRVEEIGTRVQRGAEHRRELVGAATSAPAVRTHPQRGYVDPGRPRGRSGMWGPAAVVTLPAQESFDDRRRLVRLLQLRKISGALDRDALKLTVRSDERRCSRRIGEARMIPEDEERRGRS